MTVNDILGEHVFYGAEGWCGNDGGERYYFNLECRKVRIDIYD